MATQEYEKIWNYREILEDIPKLRSSFAITKSRYILAAMLDREAHAISDRRKRKRAMRECAEHKSRVAAHCEILEVCGVVIANALHGLYLFPFRNPDDSDSVVLLLYRDSMDEPDSWITPGEARHDTKLHPSRLAAGVVRPIPPHWKKS